MDEEKKDTIETEEEVTGTEEDIWDSIDDSELYDTEEGEVIDEEIEEPEETSWTVDEDEFSKKKKEKMIKLASMKRILKKRMKTVGTGKVGKELKSLLEKLESFEDDHVDEISKKEFADRYSQIIFLIGKLMPGLKDKAKTVAQQIKAIASAGAGKKIPYPKPYPYPMKQAKAEMKEEFTEVLKDLGLVKEEDLQKKPFNIKPAAWNKVSEELRKKIVDIWNQFAKEAGYPSPYQYPAPEKKPEEKAQDEVGVPQFDEQTKAKIEDYEVKIEEMQKEIKLLSTPKKETDETIKKEDFSDDPEAFGKLMVKAYQRNTGR